MQILVPKPILDYMCEQSSVGYLQKNTAKAIITHKNIKYVTTGYGAKGDEGNLWCWAKKIVPLELYKNELKPVKHDQCVIEVNQVLRERGYNGQIFTFEGKKYVTIPGPNITFMPTMEGVQIDMFN